MITIKAQSSPRNATRYFSEHLSHDDYYSAKEQTVGRWFDVVPDRRRVVVVCELRLGNA